MTAAAGGVAVLRTCEPWMSPFHMALACRVTRNTVMTAVIAHTAVWPPTHPPTPASTPAAHLRETRMGEPVTKSAVTLDMAGTQTFMTRANQTFLSMFWQHLHHIHPPPQSLLCLTMTAAVTTPPELLPGLQEESCRQC